MLWNHVEVCSVFCLAAMRNKICYQTIKEKPSHRGLKRKISRLVFKLFPVKAFTLSKYSPVTWHYSPATAILNETRNIYNNVLSRSCMVSVFLVTQYFHPQLFERVWEGTILTTDQSVFFKDVNESYITSWCCVVKYWKKLPW